MSFIEKNLKSITEILQCSLFAEETVKYPGLLQGFDPRIKIICFIFLLFAINLSRSIHLILAFYLSLLLFAYVSKIPLRLFIARVWLFLPFFTGVIAFPAIFNIFSPGKTLFTLIDLPSYHLYVSVTQNGLISALFLITRVAASVSLAVILVLTTDWVKLLKAMEMLHLPQIFVVISLMTYRYIFVLLTTTNNMFLARKSRMVGRPLEKSNRLFISSTVGNLFGKTHKLSEDIYSAMKSRGYSNKIYILSEFKYSFIDYLAFSVTVIGIFTFYIIFR